VSALAYPESDLLRPLVEWLFATRRLRGDSLIIPEFPWHGRFVDLATLTRSGSTAAFELKLSKTRQALRQSVLNTVSFDRSYIAMGTRPSTSNLVQAHELGIGVIYVDPLAPRIVELIKADKKAVHRSARRRLIDSMRARGGVGGVW
jgi:hypothetical protein